MMQVYKQLSTCFGIGYIKGGGTVAAMVICVCWYFVCKIDCSNFSSIGFTLILIALGIWCSSEVESVWGKDSSKVVIDEVAGMCVSLLFLPVQWKYITTAFLLFRFFDIVKPLYIRRLENMPKGWGVMLDDLLAGIYANLIMQIIIATNLFK